MNKRPELILALIGLFLLKVRWSQAFPTSELANSAKNPSISPEYSQYPGYDNFYGEGNLVYDPENYLFFRRPYRSGRLQVVRLKRASTPRQQRSEASDRLQVIRLKRGVDGALKVVRL